MRKSVAIFCMVCSVFLLLGHSLLPHNHADDSLHSCIISDEEETSFADILAHTLSHNLGENHLKDFRVCGSDKFFFGGSTHPEYICELNFSSAEQAITVSEIFYSSEPSAITAKRTIPNKGLRAPPIL